VETELPPDRGPDSGTNFGADFGRDFGRTSDPGPEPAVRVSAVVPVVAAPPISEPPAYHDRGTVLVVFGVFQIILGLLAALMVPLAAFGAFMSRLAPGGGTMRPGQFIAGVASYAFLAAALIGLGIGSVQMKRWARALTLVTSWYGLITGSLITVLLTAMLPVAMRSILAQAQRNVGGAAPTMSTGAMAVVLTLIIIFAAFFLVAVPISFVVFYSRQDVLETVRRRDPIERWTDLSPLPVLGASVVFAIAAFYSLLAGVTTPVFPFFGRYLAGIPGSACFVVVAVLDSFLAGALFRQEVSGWWLAVVSVPLRVVSVALTYARASTVQAFSKMGMSDAQVKMLSANPMFRGHVLQWWGTISMLLLFGYLLWLKRYFKTPASSRTDALPAQVG
jgi:hypothetical protein